MKYLLISMFVLLHLKFSLYLLFLSMRKLYIKQYMSLGINICFLRIFTKNIFDIKSIAFIGRVDYYLNLKIYILYPFDFFQ